MSQNPILDELYAIRERLLADAGGDLQKFLAGVREREAASGRLLQEWEKTVSKPDPSLTNGCSGPAARAAEPGP
jgi:hypothetical protein